MNVTVRVPALGERPLGPLLDALEAAPRVAPFDPDTVDLLARLAQRLLDDPFSRVHPELMALGFFLRRSELKRMAAEFAATERPDVVRVPHGLVFHVPPANVDTIFVYSWAHSVLAGNTNLVRLSSRPSPVVDHLVDRLAELVTDHPMAGRLAMVGYGHDDAITAAISARSALRVVWGGDASVEAIRRAPLAPHARELTFGDRWSLVALRATAVSSIDDTRLHALADAVFNDVFWFDQRGCSSPRLALWLGTESEADAAGARLWPAVAAAVARRGYQPDPSARMGREVFVYRAVLDGPVTGRADHGPALAVARVSGLDGLRRDHPGVGLLYEAVAPSLDVLHGWVARKDQTLTHFGLSRDELVGLARTLGGRGLDRMVPVGRALQMSRFWDGHDLATAFLRPVHVVAE